MICLIHGFPDKGVSIGGAPGTSIRNTLIYECGVGISAYASTNVLIENTTGKTIAVAMRVSGKSALIW